MKAVSQVAMTCVIAGLESIQFTRANQVRDITSIRGIVMIGSSCAGKSVIVDAVRNSASLADYGVAVPTRYITRPRRKRDNTTENRHVSPAEFEHKVAAGEIGVNWIRRMEGEREERYGFDAANGKLLPVYSGNNAFYDNPQSVRPIGLRDEVMVVGVYAPDSVRKQRLLSRSPDLVQQRPDEVAYRLGDSSENILAHADCVIRNYGNYEGVAVREIVDFIGRIVQATREAEWNGSRK